MPFTLMHVEHSGIEEYIKKLLHIEDGNKIAEFILCFLSDVITIFLLLAVILFIVSFIQTFVSLKKVKLLTNKLNPLIIVLFLSLCGVIAPTCVCTSIPIIIGLITLGIPVYGAMTFLISSSLINISSILMMFSLIGWKFTVIYICCSLLSALITGLILSTFKIKSLTEVEDLEIYDNKGLSVKERFKHSYLNMLHNIKSIWLYIVIGALLAAAFDAFAPLSVIELIKKGGILSLFLGEAIGLVVHVDIIAILPLVLTMYNAGVSSAILISFISSVAFFSFPTFLMLKNTVKMKDYAKVWVVFFIVLSLISTSLYFLI